MPNSQDTPNPDGGDKSARRSPAEETTRIVLDPPPTFPRVWPRHSWPRRKFNWIARRRQAASRYLFTTALRRGWQGSGVLGAIGAHAEHVLHTWFLDWTAAPLEWNARLLQLTFCDLYLPEEFDRLFNGLERLRAHCRGSRFFGEQQIDKWIRDARHRSGGAALNYAYFSFTKLRANRRPGLLSGVHVWLVQISPSVIAATFIADPSPALQEYFDSFVKSDRSQEADILRFHWKHGITRMQSYDGGGARQIEYDELFLSANAEFSRLLRVYLGVGLVMQGPLQAIEVIAVDIPLGNLPASFERSDDDLPLWRGVSFLQSLSGRFEPWRTFLTSWYKLHPVERDDRYDIGSYQMLVSSTDYRAQRGTKRTSDTEESDLQHSLDYVHYSVGPLLAVESFYRHLRRSVLDVRNEIVPILHESGRSRRLRQLHYGQQRISRANELAYKEARVWSELNSKRGWTWFAHDIANLKRPKDEHLHLEESTFAAAVFDHIAFLHSFAIEQMALIRPAYRELLDYHVIEMNARLQGRIFTLTIVATLATVAALLPDSVRTAIVAAIRGWLSCWFR